MMKRSAIVALFAAALALGACQSTQKQGDMSSAHAVNSTCPYSDSAADPSVTSTFDGKTIAFCCNGCKAKFDGASTEKKKAIMAKAQ